MSAVDHAADLGAGLSLVGGPAAPSVDRAASRAVRSLVALGQDVDDPELAETPRRVVAAFEELLTPSPFRLTTFANEEGYDDARTRAEFLALAGCARAQ